MNTPFFSIVIPTYNRGDFIPKTIQTLLDQSFDDFEVIVVDDGSSDDTEQVIGEMRDPRLSYHKKENGERGAARNYGAKLAKGEYVNFFDSDDFAYPNHLQVAKNFIAEKDNPEIFHQGYDVKYPDGELIRIVDTLPDELNDVLINGNHLSCNGVFVRKDIALENPFNEDRKLSAAEDYELWMRMASRFDFLNCNTVTSTVLNHEGRSVIDTNPDKLIERVSLLIKYLAEDEQFTNKYEERFHELKAGLMFYISLHLAMTKKHRSMSIAYLRKGVGLNVSLLFSRRFLGVVKNLIL